jgi:hypothetical protein
LAFAASLLATSVCAQLPAPVTEYDNGSWDTTLDSYDNNDATAGNGPILGTGIDSDGKYWTWTITVDEGDVQHRVHSKDLDADEEGVLGGLEGKHVELDVDSGKLQDIHEDV